MEHSLEHFEILTTLNVELKLYV